MNDYRLYHGKAAYLSIIFTRWRKMHMICMVVAFFTACANCFTIVVFGNKFHPNCPLYANIRVAEVTGDDSNDVSYMIIEQGKPGEVTVWGSDETCNFVRYAPLTAVLASVIWLLLLCILKAFSPNFHMKLVPCISISGLGVTAVTLAVAVMVSQGGYVFCNSFKSTKLQKCVSAQYVRWVSDNDMQGFYDYLKRSEMTAWLSTHTWFFHTVMAIIRWSTNADYAIAEERELKEKPPEIFSKERQVTVRRIENTDSDQETDE